MNQQSDTTAADNFHLVDAIADQLEYIQNLGAQRASARVLRELIALLVTKGLVTQTEVSDILQESEQQLALYIQEEQKQHPTAMYPDAEAHTLEQFRLGAEAELQKLRQALKS